MSRCLPQETHQVQTLKNVCLWLYFLSRESLLKGISTIDLLVLASLDQLLSLLKMYIFLSYKTSYLNEEVNRTGPSP